MRFLITPQSSPITPFILGSKTGALPDKLAPECHPQKCSSGQGHSKQRKQHVSMP